MPCLHPELIDFNRFLMLSTVGGPVFHTLKSGFSGAFICRNFARPPGIIFPLRIWVSAGQSGLPRKMIVKTLV